MTERKRNPRIYEINTVVWLSELSRSRGVPVSLGQVPASEWNNLRSLGVDYIWFMGVWKRSSMGLRIFRQGPEYEPFLSHLDEIFPEWHDEDIVGSPYSITAYEPDLLVGTWDDIDRARQELRDRDMGLILDFVPNHTAPDHPWAVSRPEYFFQASDEEYAINPGLYSQVNANGTVMYLARGKDPFSPPWTDTLQLNYFNPEMRNALIRELQKIAGHCDGVRCDMAMLVLNDIFRKNWQWAAHDNEFDMPSREFWTDARDACPELLLIAEAYWDTEWRLQQLGFDYVYDKRLYDRILHAAPSEVNLHLKADISYQEKLVRFLENHDEPRSAGVMGSDKLRACAVLFSTLPGMKLYHHGQMEGRKIRIPVQLKRAPEESSDSRLNAFYKWLLMITGREIFSRGKWQLEEVQPHGDGSYSNLIAYSWRFRSRITIVVVNLSPDYSQGRILLRDGLPGADHYSLHDVLNNERYERNREDLMHNGLHVILDGYRSHIFDIVAG